MAGANMERVYNLGSRCLMQLGLAAGVTLAEYQHVDLQLGRDRLRESRFQALNAYQGIVSGYFLFPVITSYSIHYTKLYDLSRVCLGESPCIVYDYDDKANLIRVTGLDGAISEFV